VANMSGPYYVYRALTPYIQPSDLADTIILGDPRTTSTHFNAIPGPSYFYWVTNAAIPATSPVVAWLTPPAGPAAGGTSVSIYGDNFTPGSTVTFGGVAATSVVLVNSSKITCVTPAHVAGSVDVRVTNTNGQFGEAIGGFNYGP